MPGRKVPEEQRRLEILKAAYRVAGRERLTGLTAQAVAAEAGVSKGLVFFHFGNRDGLLVALLKWLLGITLVGPDMPELLAGRTPGERLMSALRRDVEALPRQRERVELFFDFWVMGTRHPEVQRAIRAALDGYRDAYRPLAQAVVDADPARFGGIGAEGLAGVVAGFIEGCAIQAVMDPERFNVESYMRTLAALVAEAGNPRRAE
ncbi:TetR/AcrR family transcriptional regulator [Longimicrobium terrae]|uniref:AcrR family transcriptional regulator n=1 Tax=Longimicrobium terrae TaxID=1639882 RepID=A0A841H7C7_9BACT|nr:TetR family transcriptional regulator C-terminal domain-containing protein [Longimicrobium terrae]MBB4639516.1 AcrR family transcriptional regulator [Longimicrobium terrae]MBB6073888.1 AcrR family transcriptional regulator [Longimicrobium terrae]NNC32494.1 TetR/AcrR family transcriptional regulator [Longimicrobium terrae]